LDASHINYLLGITEITPRGPHGIGGFRSAVPAREQGLKAPA
jgi:hypothetical protein